MGLLGFLGKKRNAKQVVSFDVSTEVFKLFLLPDFVLRNRCLRWIDVHRNFPCVIKPEEGQCYEIWVMEEYGVQESWTRLHAIQLFSLSHPLRFLGLGMNGRLVFENLENHRELTVYYPENKKLKNVELDNSKVDLLTVGTYIESLVAL
ncbi:hypothetical protein POUND7_003856 [Theobroma cacao]